MDCASGTANTVKWLGLPEGGYLKFHTPRDGGGQLEWSLKYWHAKNIANQDVGARRTLAKLVSRNEPQWIETHMAIWPGRPCSGILKAMSNEDKSRTGQDKSWSCHTSMFVAIMTHSISACRKSAEQRLSGAKLFFDVVQVVVSRAPPCGILVPRLADGLLCTLRLQNGCIDAAPLFQDHLGGTQNIVVEEFGRMCADPALGWATGNINNPPLALLVVTLVVNLASAPVKDMAARRAAAFTIMQQVAQMMEDHAPNIAKNTKDLQIKDMVVYSGHGNVTRHDEEIRTKILSALEDNKATFLLLLQTAAMALATTAMGVAAATTTTRRAARCGRWCAVTGQ